jgi:hypothetical protein
MGSDNDERKGRSDDVVFDGLNYEVVGPEWGVF